MHRAYYRSFILIGFLMISLSATGCSSCKKATAPETVDSAQEQDQTAQVEEPLDEEEAPIEKPKNRIVLDVSGGPLEEPAHLEGESLSLNVSDFAQNLAISGLGDGGKGFGINGYQSTSLDKITIALHNEEPGTYTLTEEDRLSFFFDRTQDGRRVRYALGWQMLPGATIHILPDTISDRQNKGELRFEGDVKTFPSGSFDTPLHIKGSIQSAGR